VHLLGKLSSGLYDQDAQFPKWALLQLLQYREKKGRRFSGSGLRQSQKVAPLKHQGNRLLLYWSWTGETRRPDGGVDIWIKLKLIEVQRTYAPWLMSQVALLAQMRFEIHLTGYSADAGSESLEV
jgi:hypothetical protein